MFDIQIVKPVESGASSVNGSSLLPANQTNETYEVGKGILERGLSDKKVKREGAKGD
jgi:hypothetical protein